MRQLDRQEQQRNGLIKGVLIWDAIALLLLYGKTVTLPGLGVSLAEIPAAREVAIFIGSFSFLFCMIAILNTSAYENLIDTVNRFRNLAIDPDFLSAADRPIGFVHKMLRGKMNIHGVDFLIPSRASNNFAKVTNFLVLTSVISILLLHLLIAILCAIATFHDGRNYFPTYLYLIVLGIINLAAAMIFATGHIYFTYHFPNYPDPSAGSEGKT